MNRHTQILTLTLLLTSCANQVMDVPTNRQVGGSVEQLAINTKPVVIPSLRQWTGDSGDFILITTSRIIARQSNLVSVANQLATDLLKVTGVQPQVVTGVSVVPVNGDIVLSVDSTFTPANPEGYTMTIGGNLDLQSTTPQGLMFGTRTVLQILSGSVSKDRVPRGSIVDYPDYKERGLMLDVGRKFFTKAYLKDYIKMMGYFKLNTLHLHLNDNPAFRLQSTNPAFAGLAPAGASYTRQDWDELEATAALYGVKILPEIDAPAHAQAMVLFKRDLAPQKMDLSLNGNTSELDVARPEAVDFMKSIFDEFVPWFKSNEIHIGADEYGGSSTYYTNYINTINRHLNSKGKTTRVWGSLTRKNISGSLLDSNINMDSWRSDEYSVSSAIAAGFNVSNSFSQHLYLPPYFETSGNEYHPYGLDNQYLYQNWTPEVSETSTTSTTPFHPKLLGAKMSIWNDMYSLGYTEQYVHGLTQPSLGVIAQKTWNGTNNTDISFDAFRQTQSQLGTGPNLELLQNVMPDINNLAINAPTTASSQFNTTNRASQLATDGNLMSRWSSNYTDNEWLTVDLGTAKTISRVVVNWEGAYGKDYDLQVSQDGTTWTTVAQRRANTSLRNVMDFNPTTARYVRVQGLTRATQYGYSIWELEIYNIPDLARGATTTASSQYNTTTRAATLATDGDANTRWSSNYTDNEWLTVDLGSEKVTARAIIDWETAYGKDYDLQVSSDGLTWNTVFQRRNFGGGTDTLNFGPFKARYVRIKGLLRGTQWGYSIWNFKVYGK